MSFRENSERSSLQDEVENIPEVKVMNKLSQSFPETELVIFLNRKDDNLVFKKTGKSCPKNVKHLGILPDKSLSYVFQVNRVSSELAKHICYQPYELIHQ